MTHAAPTDFLRKTLCLTQLEDRTVPTASVVSSLDLRAAVTMTVDSSALDPQPVQVGTNDNGEAIFTISVQPKVCNCAACQATVRASATAQVTTSPSIQSQAAAIPATSAVTQRPTPPLVVAAPQAMAAVRLESPSVAYFTPTVEPLITPPQAVLVAHSDSGHTLFAQPDVSLTAQPDHITAPATTQFSAAELPFVSPTSSLLHSSPFQDLTLLGTYDMA